MLELYSTLQQMVRETVCVSLVLARSTYLILENKLDKKNYSALVK